MAIPRAALMVVGGAYVDRLSPRRVMLASNVVRLVAVAALGAVVLSGGIQLWMLYAFALVFGIADAFFFPAVTAIVPAVVPGEQLSQANAIVQGTAQLTVFVGPALAGVLIAVFGSSAATPGTQGIGIALHPRRVLVRHLGRHPVADQGRRGAGPGRGCVDSSPRFAKASVSCGTGRQCA